MRVKCPPLSALDGRGARVRVNYNRMRGTTRGVMREGDGGVVEPRGFEPLTSSVQRRRSPGLSYGPVKLLVISY